MKAPARPCFSCGGTHFGPCPENARRRPLKPLPRPVSPGAPIDDGVALKAVQHPDAPAGTPEPSDDLDSASLVTTVEPDVAAIRKHLKMTQHKFAATFGLEVDAIRQWEQRRRRPTGATRVLLLVIAYAPEAVMNALRAAEKEGKP